MQNLTLATKFRRGEWRGALFIDNEYKDVFLGPSLTDTIADAVGGTLVQEYPEGTEIIVSVTLRVPEAKK